MAEKDPQSSSGSGSTTTRKRERVPDDQLSASAQYDRTVAEAAGEEYVQEQAPGPEVNDAPAVGVVSVLERVEPRDRNTFVGPVHKSSLDDKDPDKGYVRLDALGDDDREEVDGEEVKDFQVLGGNGATVVTINGKSFNLGALAGEFAADVNRAALTNANS